MKSILSNRTVLYLTVGTLMTMLLAVACARTGGPFDLDSRASDERAARTPSSGPSQALVPTLPPEEAQRLSEEAQRAHLESLFADTIGTVKIGEWKDNKERQLENYIAGYIMVYGYDFRVELVDTTDEGYKEALKTGDLDLVMKADQEWLNTESESGLVADAGAVREAGADTRIGVYGAIKQNAPEMMEFLGRYTPEDEKIAELAARITGGRVGIKANVAALTYLKNEADTWSQWVPATVAEKVKAAIKAGKTSLINRKCIPDGGSSAGEPNCGT